MTEDEFIRIDRIRTEYRVREQEVGEIVALEELFKQLEIARLGPILAVHPMGEPEHYATAFTKHLKGKSVVVVGSAEVPNEG